MFGFFGGGAPAEPDYTLSTAELNEMQKKYTELQEAHTRELQAIHGKLVQENDALKGKLRSTEDELKLYKVNSSSRTDSDVALILSFRRVARRTGPSSTS